MTNVCLGDRSQLELLVSNKYFEISCLLLKRPGVSDNVVNNMLWSYANFAGKDFDTRDMILNDSNTIEGILGVASRPKLSEKTEKILIWLFSNLMRGAPYPTLNQTHLLLPHLTKIFTSREDPEFVLEGTWAFLWFIESPDELEQRVQYLLNNPKIVELIKYYLLSENHMVAQSAVKFIGFLVSTGNNRLVRFLDSNLVGVMNVYL